MSDYSFLTNLATDKTYQVSRVHTVFGSYLICDLCSLQNQNAGAQ